MRSAREKMTVASRLQHSIRRRTDATTNDESAAANCHDPISYALEMALINISGKVVEIDRVSNSAIVKSGNSDSGCFCLIPNEAFICRKKESGVPSCDDLSLGDHVHFNAEPMLKPTLKRMSDDTEVEVTHSATKAWLPSVPNSRNALTNSIPAKVKETKTKGQMASAKEVVQENVAAISKTMVKKACTFMYGIIRSNGGMLTFEDISTMYSSFPVNVQKVIGPNPLAFNKFIKNHKDRFKTTKSGTGVMLADVSDMAPKIDPQEAEEEARIYVCRYLAEAGGKANIYSLLAKTLNFPKHIRGRVGERYADLKNFVKRHAASFKLDGLNVSLVRNVELPWQVRVQTRAEDQVQVSSEAIVWSWGKGVVVALGKTFGYIAKDPRDNDQLISFDADSFVLNEEPRDADCLAEIQKDAAVRYVAYACQDLSSNRRAWKALVVWKSDAKAQDGLFNGPVRVVQGRVSSVFRAGGSVTLGRSSDIRIPFSCSVIMCRSPVHEATEMMSVGDEVSCVLREAMVEQLPCLVVECVWKTKLFEECPSAASNLNPVTDDVTVYGSGKVSGLTPSGGFINHRGTMIAFRSGDLYVDGEMTLPTKLKKGTDVFYYAVPSSERTRGGVSLEATLVWKGKKPKFQSSSDQSPLPLAALPQQPGVNLLLTDLDGPCPDSVQVPGDTRTSLSLDNKGGILVQVKDAEDCQNIVQDLHVREQSENPIAKVDVDLGQYANAEENDKELQEARDAGTQTISTGDIISLRLHTS